MYETGGPHDFGCIVTHKCYGSRFVKDAILNSKAAVMDNPNDRHVHQASKSIEQAFIHGISHSHAGIEDKCEQYQTEGLVPVFESRQILADEGNGPTDEQGLAAA